MTTLNLVGVNNLHDLLERLPDGHLLHSAIKKLGLWSTGVNTDFHNNQVAFPTNPRLSNLEISQAFSQWNSELIRAGQFVGLVEGLSEQAKLRLKRAQARARARARREHLDEVAAALTDDPPRKIAKMTVSEISDVVESDEDVIAAEDVMASFGVILSSARAYRESCLHARDGLSREISFRQAQLASRARA